MSARSIAIFAEDAVQNGFVWRNDWRHLDGVSQYLTDDMWVLMSEPYAATHGGTACMAMSIGSDHKVICTLAELATRLAEEGWHRIGASTEGATP